MQNIIPQNDTPKKRCYKCKQFKSRTPENFGPDKRSPDCFRSCCRECRHIEYEESLQRNPNLISEKYRASLRKPFDDQEKLREYNAAKHREYRSRKTPEGICGGCRTRPCEPGHLCDHCLSYHREYAKKHGEQQKAYNREVRDQLRRQVLDAYGNKCACCGETQPEFLAIDHIHGGGNAHRRAIGLGMSLYRWLRDQGFPQDDLQL